MNYFEIWQHLKNRSWQMRSEPIVLRRQRLEKLLAAIEKRESLIIEALRLDFKKSEAETLLTEIFPTLQELKFAIKNLEAWARPLPVPAPLTLWTSKSFLYYEPKGTVLIISPWNYPFQLTLGPLIPALAAGNNAIIKPSEFTPATNKVVTEIVKECFTPDEALVIEGDASTTTELLKLPFDHIFFTGSTQVGKIVMKAASEHLASVTLELGGKSPAIVDDTADLSEVARKLTWGKSVNAGQTCVAPDYVLVPRTKMNELAQSIASCYQSMYGNSIEANADFPAIINTRHHQRLNQLLEASLDKALLASPRPVGDTLKMPLAVIPDAATDSLVMKDEIFGPLLPLVPYDHLNEAIQFIQSRPKPLALYIFSEEPETQERILRQTSSGGVLINDTLLHLANHNLPFGGVGESGLGNYHGYFGFKTFSHEKSVMKQSRLLGTLFAFFYAPYTPIKLKIIRWLSRF